MKQFFIAVFWMCVIAALTSQTFRQELLRGLQQQPQQQPQPPPQPPQQQQPPQPVAGPAMQFSWHTPCGGSGCEPYILAQGDITEQTPGAFQQFLTMDDISRPPALGNAKIYLDSPGGSVYAALQLGEMIRKLRIITYVGGPYREAVYPPGQPPDSMSLVEHGRCMSACVYVFAAGRLRIYDADEGVIGIHRFHGPVTDEAQDHAQVVQAGLSAYLEEMGVDRKMLETQAMVAPAEIRPVTREEAHAWQLDNTTAPEGRWELKAIENGTLFLMVGQARPGDKGRAFMAFWRATDQLVGVELRYWPETEASRDTSPLGLQYQQQLDGEYVDGAKALKLYLEAEPMGNLDSPDSDGGGSNGAPGSRYTHDCQTRPGGTYGVKYYYNCQTQFTGTATWTRTDGDGYRASFLIPVSTLQALAVKDKFGIEWEWSHAGREYDPSMVFGTLGLREGIPGLLANQQP
jgi:hypothetical protein